MLGRRIQVFFCALLATVAVLCLVATLSNIGALGAGHTRDEYLLQSRDGVVCLYRLPDRRTPVVVSDVKTAALSLSEQLDLSAGIGAADYAEALALLGSMGS